MTATAAPGRVRSRGPVALALAGRVGRGVGPAIFVAITLAPLLVLAVDAAAAGLPVDPTARTMRLLATSVGVAVAVTLLAVLAGVGAAVGLAVAPDRIRRWAGPLVLLPLFVPTYVYALTWVGAAAPRAPFGRVLAAVLPGGAPTFGVIPTVVALGTVLAPVVALTVRSALAGLDPGLVDAGRLLVDDAAVWRRVVWPQIAPAVRAGAVVVGALALVEYGVPALFQVNVYAMEVYADYSLTGDPGAAFATALPLLAVAAVAAVAAARWLRHAPLRTRPAATAALAVLGRPRSVRATIGLGTAVLGLGVVAPVVVLAVESGGPGTLVTAVRRAWSELGVSLGLAVAVAGVVAVLALPVARWVDRARGIGPWLVVLVPLAVPAALLTLGLLAVWTRVPGAPVVGTPVMLLLAHVARVLPVAVLVVVVGLRRLDRDLLDAARVHAPGPWRRLWRVELPVLAPWLAAAAGVGAVLSLGELGASLLAVPPGSSTVPLRMFNLMHYGAGDEVAALSLATMAIVLFGVVGGVQLWRRRGGDRDRAA